MNQTTATSVPEGTEITIPDMDNLHAHYRDEARMASTVALLAASYRRAVAMPNLKPPLTTIAMVWEYYLRILEVVKTLEVDFEPLMAFYLTEQTTVSEIIEIADNGWIRLIKGYPAGGGGTTNSASGITDFGKVKEQIRVMADHDIILSLHCEVPDPNLNPSEKERRFIADVLPRILDDNPDIRLIVEHVSTKEAVAFVESCGDNVAATITSHHITYTEDDLRANPAHMHCFPILQRNEDRQALLRAATSGSKKFFLGDDHAPHAQTEKEMANGRGGCFVAHDPGLYLDAFESVGALDKFAAFASKNGADFYGLRRNTGETTLVREDWIVPATYSFGETVAVPINACRVARWKVKRKKN